MSSATTKVSTTPTKITSSSSTAPQANTGFSYGVNTVPNPLSYYASYNYNLSLSVLDDESFNNATYKNSGAKGPFLAYSANKDPDNRVNTVYGKFDFFIEDLKISHLIGFERVTGNTNAMGFSFKIIEPYSMGLFFIALQQEALAKGHKNYLDAPLLLTLEFRGHISGNPAVDIQNIFLSNLTKHYPLKLRLIDMKVSSKGCEYEVSAYPANEAAFEKAKVTLTTPAVIHGETVEEILKKHPKKSFELYINSKEKDQKDNKLKDVQDQYLIEFPPGPGGEENPIKSSSLGFTLYDGTKTPYAEDDFVYENGVYKRGNIEINPKLSEFTFAQGTDIINVINQVIFFSDYGRNALKNISSDGFINWWRIEVNLKYITSDANLPKIGTKPKQFIYRIKPYRVSASYFLPNNEKLAGTDADKKLVTKVYNYIYSGNNIDIIDFDINFKAGFYTAINADASLNNEDKKLKEDTGIVVDSKDKNGSQITPGSSPGNKEFANRTEYISNGASTMKMGGSTPEDPASLAARQFYDVLTAGVDMINAELTILGDPYYLGDSGIGNYHASNGENLYINSDGCMNWDNTEIHILVNFKTPVDIDLSTGLYDFGRLHNSTQFSGLYRVLKADSFFVGGKFTQKLKIIRLKGQEASSVAVAPVVPSEETFPEYIY